MKSKPTKTLVVIDANNLAHRVRHTMDELYTSEGIPTGVIYGVLNCVLNLFEGMTPAGVVLCWDGGLSTRRVQASKGLYKANRSAKREEATPEEKVKYEQFQHQMRTAQVMVDKLGFTNAAGIGVEADDIMALAAAMVTAGHMSPFERTLVVTTDKDAFQLVSPTCDLWYARKGGYVLITPDTFKKHTIRKEIPEGFPNPQVYRLYHCLIGDSGDNIFPVSGIGPKTAYRLIEETKFPVSLKSFMSRLPDVMSCQDTRAREAAEYILKASGGRQLELNNELVDLRKCYTDSAVISTFAPMYSQLLKPQTDWPGFAAYCRELEMQSFRTRDSEIQGYIQRMNSIREA